MKKKITFYLLSSVTLLAAGLIVYTRLYAHCDSLDGPVVQAARNALDTKNVNLVLIWVQKQDEAEVREAFERTLAVRGQNPEAKELADTYFFETVVRIHRQSEGAAYTGLKPGGSEINPAIRLADSSLITGSPERVQELLLEAVRETLNEKFKEMTSRKNYDINDVDAGREYVKKYVEYIHFCEGVYESATHGEKEHHSETGDEPPKSH